MAGVRAKKHFGQHFLTDNNIAGRIVGALTFDGYSSVLEIGPGTGVLSRMLLKMAIRELRAIEVDRESVDYLHKNLPDLNLLSGDFLRFNMGEIPGGKLAIIGNFPYNISSQILFRVLDDRDRVIELVGMFQKEVAERISAPPGSKKYGILSVLLKVFYDIEYLFEVPPSAFNPPPKVTSAVVRLRRNDVLKQECDEKLFRRIVKSTFNQRRKMIRNSLGSVIDIREEMNSLLSKRPEQLGVDEFTELTKWIEGIINKKME